MAGTLLPAIMLGIDNYIDLAILRNLGEHGIRIYGLARTPCSFCLASRFLYRSMQCPKEEDGIIQRLVALRRELGTACLFATNEADIVLLNRHRERLQGLQLMFPDTACMERVLNKEYTYTAAREVGIRVPRTEHIRSLDEIRARCTAMRYPVVLKWANPLEATQALKQLNLAPEKSHYCSSAEDLDAYLRRFEALNIFPIIQEYCPGEGLCQSVLMHDGEPNLVFQHRRVHEWPPEGGVSSMCESIGIDKHHDLMEKSIALLRRLEWEGVASVEYRHDSASDVACLMEVNGRFWGSLSLACSAGAPFPWAAYEVLAMKRPITQQSYRSHVRCRCMSAETKRLLRIEFAPGRIANPMLKFRRLGELGQYLLAFVHPDTHYFVFRWNDPKPFFHDVVRLVRSMPTRLRERGRQGLILSNKEVS
jgi:predicted ATP-grasp superfamily ATP-dependent carboligase